MICFQFNVDPCGPALDLEVPLDIIIGTIPLKDSVENIAPPPQPPAVVQQPVPGIMPGINSDPVYPPPMPMSIPNCRK